MTSVELDQQGNWPEGFSLRTERLRAVVWRTDDAGARVTPLASGALGAFVDSVRVRAASAACTTGRSEAEVMTGIKVRRHDAADGTRVYILMPTRAGVGSPYFERICEELRLDHHATVEALRSGLRESMSDARGLAFALGAAFDDLARLQSSTLVATDFSERLSQSYEETYTLFRIMRFMASEGEPAQLIQMLIEHVKRALPMGFVAMQYLDGPAVTTGLRGSCILSGEFPHAREAFSAALISLAAGAKGDNWTRILEPGREEAATLAGAEVVCEPVTYCGQIIGVLVAGCKYGRDPMIASPEMQFVEAVADFLGTFHENIARFEEQRAMSIGMLKALTASIDAKDPYTRGHSERVAQLSSAIAIAMGFTAEQAERVRIAGMVHDVGKIGVPEAILLKQGKLTDEEFDAIKKHPDIGYGILKDIIGLEDVLPGVLHHHERFDGRGYPQRLKGEDVPLIARIIGLADTFDAMSSTRSYRSALPREKVLEELERCAGAQFDPAVVKAFAKVTLDGYDRLLEEHRVFAPKVGPEAGDAQGQEVRKAA